MIGSLLLLTLILFIIIEAVSAKDRFYHLIVESIISNAYSPDCQDLVSDFRYLFVVRDALNPEAIEPGMPGPKIEADEGDILHIQVTNMNQVLGTTIHWHGIHQIGTPFMDGTQGISQCAIQPWESQNYTFVAEPPGTHFWHGHAGMDIADGITGPIIIHPKNGYPFEYDDDVVVFFQDFYTQTGTQQQVGLYSFPFVWVGNGNSILVGKLSFTFYSFTLWYLYRKILLIPIMLYSISYAKRWKGHCSDVRLI
jgi:FtsP/CotA-like multicopper oxidase with cupredoxin domain